jgi:hypothetical protein
MKNPLLLALLTSLLVSTVALAQKKKKKAPPPEPPAEVVQENTQALCQDGEDNDQDGFIDCDDQDCQVLVACATEEAPAASQAQAEGDAANAEEEELVDLDSLEEEEGAPASGGHPGGHPHGGADGRSKMPKFKLFFDLLIEYEFETKMFDFTRDHAHIMLELEATDWLTFRTDVAFEPEFFEGIFHIRDIAEFRVGKILVPFGQNEFHHLIGGRVDKESRFLPTVWGDYGFAFKHFAFNGDFLSFDYIVWCIKGFQANSDNTAPDMRASANWQIEDNNQMKGVGVRPTLGLGRAVTLGTSWYVDAYDPDNNRWMLVYGADVELGYDLIPVPFLRDLRWRMEIAWAEARLQKNDNPYHGILAGEGEGILANYGLRKAGYNLELNYRIIKWLFLRYREGWLNDNSREKNAKDLLVHEPGILAVVGPVQFSLMVQILQRLYKEVLDENSPIYDEPDEYSRILFRVLYRY